MRQAGAIEQLVTKVTELEQEAQHTARAFQDTDLTGYMLLKAWESLVQARMWLEETEKRDD